LKGPDTKAAKGATGFHPAFSCTAGASTVAKKQHPGNPLAIERAYERLVVLPYLSIVSS
jgi:hypothetical protein